MRAGRENGSAGGEQKNGTKNKGASGLLIVRELTGARLSKRKDVVAVVKHIEKKLLGA